MKTIITTGMLIALLSLVSCKKEQLESPFTPTSGYKLMQTNFTSKIIGNSYEWNFGDYNDPNNNTSTGLTASHKYNFSGSYLVKLKITNAQGPYVYSSNINIM